MKEFKLDHQMQYVVYGAGGNCYRVLETLENAGCSVSTIIDKRARELGTVKNVPVVLLEEMYCNEPQNVVVIITVKNVFDHTAIAIQLLERGFCNLIYKPLPTLHGEIDEVWGRISQVYEELVEKRTIPEDELTLVPSSCLEHMEVFPERLPIKEIDDEMVCWMPVELLFNYDVDDSYGRQHMAAFYPLVNFYSYLLGDERRASWEEAQEDYFLYSADWVKRNEVEYTADLKKSQIESRLNVFLTMQKDTEINKDFFIENAVRATLGSNLHFYVSSSGRNRISFMIAKGYNYVPMKISCKDYEKWKNQAVCEEVHNLFGQWKVRTVYTTIPHPIFREYAVRRIDYSRMFCMPVISEIVRWLHWESKTYEDGYVRVDYCDFQRKKREKRVSVGINDQGTLSRYLAMEQINSIRMVNEESDAKIAYQIDRLLYMDNNEFLVTTEDVVNALESSDIAILSSNYFELIDVFEGELLFWLQEDGCFEDTLWLQKGYCCVKKMFSSVWEGSIVSGYMLKRMRE